MNFTTTLARKLEHPHLKHLASAACDEDLPDEVEVEVEVDYNPGWFTPGRLSGPPEDCYPDEGEDPEITAVVILETDEDITLSLSDAEYQRLVQAALDDQEAQEDDCYGPDLDYPDY